ncbi:MAG: hypothetical protein HOP15_09065 [Planctomycetes bacterium]|nr:hypothetical protein [Planctomycetota bacterium]
MVVVHPENPTRSITRTELRRILRAEVQEWSSRDTIQLLLPRSGSSEKRVLLDLVYDMNDLQLKRYWTRLIYEHRIVEAPLSVPSPAVALRTLERMRGSLTVVPASALQGSVRAKVLAIDGILPGDEGYPLWLDSPSIVEHRASTPKRVSEASAARDEEPAAASAEQQEVLERLATLEEALATQRDGMPSLSWRLFGHMEAEYEEDSTAGEPPANNAFSIEVLDLLITSALSERFSILTETVFEALDDNEFDIEVERLILKYRFSDALSIQGGRFLTTLGYWNSKYHHGEWLQTSIDRPEILNFEGDDGILPLHSVGVSLKGAFFGEALSADYALEVANGRGPTPDEAQDKLDANDEKALNLSIGLQPSAVPGLRLGGGTYIDNIPMNIDPGAGQVHGDLDERITNAYWAYEDSHWEAMGEYFWIDHEGAGVATESSGWYLQVGRRLADFVPYVRLDAAHLDDQDPYFGTSDDTSTVALGVRYDPVRWVALTLQYERTNIDAPAGDPNGRTNTVVLQATF